MPHLMAECFIVTPLNMFSQTDERLERLHFSPKMLNVKISKSPTLIGSCESEI